MPATYPAYLIFLYVTALIIFFWEYKLLDFHYAFLQPLYFHPLGSINFYTRPIF